MVQNNIKDEEDTTCSICLGDYVNGELVSRVIPCNHIFHQACINEWINRGNDTCPICRREIQRTRSAEWPNRP